MRSLRAGWIGLLALGLVAAGLLAAGGLAVAVSRMAPVGAAGRWVAPLSRPARPSPPPGPTPAAPSPTLSPTLLQPGPVTVNSPGFWSWALLDTRTGAITGAKNLTATSTTASMIKAWIAADFLRLNTNPGQGRLDQLRIMIRDSDNAAAQEIFRLLGAEKSIARLISICQLTDSRAYRGYWSNTAVSARDTARMAACIGDGRAAGPKWTAWLLTEMRNVRGFGDFGIRKALPPDVARRTAIKNGWVLREAEGNWHVACLAIGDGWTLGVLVRYPARLGVAHGTNVCKSVAGQLLSN